MRILEFKVEGQRIDKVPECDYSGLIMGTSGYLVASFQFDDTWKNMVKVAAFYGYNNGNYDESAVLIQDGIFLIPDQAAQCKFFKVGAVGQRPGLRLTTNLVTIYQEEGSQWQP